MNKSKDSFESELYCGTSNIVLPVPNKSFFPKQYRDKTRLAYYSSIFNSLEVNSSFYKVPMPRTVEKWTSEVSDNFRFTFKLWKGITHGRELHYQSEDINKFFLAVDRVAEKKACILIQFPRSIDISYFQKVKRLLDEVAGKSSLTNWKLAVEFREASWYQDKVYQMLGYYDAIVVKHDMPTSIPPDIDIKQKFVFMRFHGENGDYKGSYSNEVLEVHAKAIKGYLNHGLQVFVYFNNTIGDAVHNALYLKAMFEEQS